MQTSKQLSNISHLNVTFSCKKKNQNLNKTLKPKKSNLREKI